MSKARRRLRKFIPVEAAIARWRKDAAYLKEYEALEEEFRLAAEIVRIRSRRRFRRAVGVPR